MKCDEYNPSKDVMPKSDADFTLRAILGRHPRIVFTGAVVGVMILTWPVMDYLWHHLVLGFE